MDRLDSASPEEYENKLRTIEMALLNILKRIPGVAHARGDSYVSCEDFRAAFVFGEEKPIHYKLEYKPKDKTLILHSLGSREGKHTLPPVVIQKISKFFPKAEAQGREIRKDTFDQYSWRGIEESSLLNAQKETRTLVTTVLEGIGAIKIRWLNL